MLTGMRTPTKTMDDKKETTPKQNDVNTTFTKTTPEKKQIAASSTVRKSIGEWEAVKRAAFKKSQKTAQTPPKTPPSAPSTSATTTASPVLTEPAKPKDRTSEARACLYKIKTQLAYSRNIKTEIKTEITLAAEKLYHLVKEAESTKTKKMELPQKLPCKHKATQSEIADEVGERERESFSKMLADHAILIKQNTESMAKLQERLDKTEKQTYASVASSARRQPPERAALHSLVVTATNEQETGEEVLNRIRKVVNAKEGGVEVERIRKAKDRKIIVGFRNQEEREKVKTRLTKDSEHLKVENMTNKDPLVVLRDVVQFNSDEDIIGALKKQNKQIFKDLSGTDRLEIAYRKRTRNPHTSHVIMRVSPKIWRRMTEAESVHIDLQRIRVADQSPLVQCSLCLGYGHGRRFCQETQAKCSHCGGAHMKADCPDWLVDTAPSCCNCTRAKLTKVEHNAFSQECPIRRKWDAMARSTTSYC